MNEEKGGEVIDENRYASKPFPSPSPSLFLAIEKTFRDLRHGRWYFRMRRMDISVLVLVFIVIFFVIVQLLGVARKKNIYISKKTTYIEIKRPSAIHTQADP